MEQAEHSFGDVTDKLVADFGCGCGTLGAAAALLGAEWVMFLPLLLRAVLLVLKYSFSYQILNN